MPAPTPVTVPVADTVAILPTAGAQLPPPPSDKVVVPLTQTAAIPEIPDGSGLTVTTAVALQPAPIE